MTVTPQPAAGPLNPLVPRPIDAPTAVPLDPDADLTGLDQAKIFIAPDDPAQWDAWRAALERWREGARGRHPDHAARYTGPGEWTAGCRVIAQVWLWDELLYDFEAGAFTPDRLLADADARFGGFDGVVLWHAYPVIGIDGRNQWDHYREVPGLRALVDALHAAGVRVFCDFNPWDTGTRRGGTDAEELAGIIADFGFDGVFLDTLKQADAALIDPLFAANPALALETESKLALGDLGTHAMSWAQWYADSPVPGVLKTHFYEPRHMQHHVRRWNRDHHEELQSAWLNGVGVMAWEVVFSAWVGWNDRDADTLRRMRPVQRAWSDLLVGGTFTPLVRLSDAAHAAGVYAASWTDGSRTLLTLVNRSDADVTLSAADLAPWLAGTGHEAGAARVLGTAADDLRLAGGPAAASSRAPAATALQAGDPTPAEGEPLLLSLTSGASVAGGVLVPARSISGVVAGPGAELVAAASASVPVGRSARFPHREAVKLPGEPATGAAPASGFVAVPAGRHFLTQRYRCRETGLYGEAPFVDEWKPLHPRLHDLRTREHVLETTGCLVAEREVTAAEFAAFVAATGHPWTPPSGTAAASDAGAAFGADSAFAPDPSHGSPELPSGGQVTPADAPRPDSGDAPATWVSLDDARAYATWVGGRLPTEFEWQLAGEASDDWVVDVVVWNWTDSEHTDGRSRFAMLKGGSDHAIQGSEWYIEPGRRGPDHTLKYLRKGFDLDRNAWTGFRVAFDRASVPGEAAGDASDGRD